MIAIAGSRCARGTAGRLFIPLLWIALAGFAGALHAADNPLQVTRERLDAIRVIFDQTEAALIRPSLRDKDLASLRDTIEPLRTELRAKTDEIEPQYADTQNRLKELGPAPAASAPPEDPKMAAQRAELTALLGELDGVLRQAKLLLLRGDQIVDRIDAARRALFTQRLFARGGSILNPALWLEAANGLPAELKGLATLVSDWKGTVDERGGLGAIAGAIVAIVALIVGILALRRVILRRIDRAREGAPPSPERHPRAAYIALCRALVDAATAPLAAFASIEVLLAFELLPARIEEIAHGLLAAIVLLSIGRAIAHAVLAPDAPARRLMLLDDATAARLYHLVAGAIIAIALAVFLHVIHRVLAAPVPVRLVTSALMALIVAFFVARLLLANRAPEDGEKDEGLPSWARLIGWIAVAAILATLATGHISLAAFIAARIVDAVIVIGGLVLLLALIDSLFAQSVTAEHARRRNLAATFGIKPGQLDFFATLIAGLLRALLFIIAAFLLIGGFGASITDIASTLDRFSFGIEVGQMRVALYDVLAAVGMLIAGLAFTRIVHRWLANTVLPKASLEVGLQNSIATIIGYLGVIAAGLLALSQLGINLQNVALIAGALSVGIGFGLQSVVSNFVSGIILLAERPIRVGDIIVVKGEEGYVRRISVRSTEIETFEHANVIIPNSELVTNVVKNWTHFNTIGRTNVKVVVAFNSNPEKVREVLLATADKHPQVVKKPAPRVLLLGFGEKALEFELRCIITNVGFAASVRSDLYFAILQSFRTEGIEMPFQQQ
jgi:potassium-dependent mechanosensitive channel